MAVELLGQEHLALQEAASAGLKSMDHLIRFVSHQQNQTVQPDCKQLADFTVSNFKKVISILNRTGHARFRRSPVQVSDPKETQPSPQTPVEKVESPALTFDFVKSKVEVPKDTLSLSANSSSSITGEGSVSNGKQTSSIGLPPRPPVSAGKPPLAGKRCRDPDELSGRISDSGKCHCNNRKSRVKKVIKVPAISSKVAEIPADEHSWRKYGQKPIKGSTYPRAYYRCSSVRGCPARKHVERATNDPTMLVVTYEGDHRHVIAGTDAGVGCAGDRMMVFGSTGQMKKSN